MTRKRRLPEAEEPRPTSKFVQDERDVVHFTLVDLVNAQPNPELDAWPDAEPEDKATKAPPGRRKAW